MAFQEEHIPLILQLTGMSRMEYNIMFFEQGIEYLKREANYDEWGVSMVSKHPMFWAWWKNVWYNFDSDVMDLFLELSKRKITKGFQSEMKEKYMFIHAAERLKLHPPKFLISAAYEKLIIEMKNSENQ